MSHIFKIASQVLLLFIILGCSDSSFISKKKNPYEYDYLAVKFSKEDYWSIVDKDGNIVVKEEYSPNDQLSTISDGAYWVRSNGRFQLYNVESPQRPINNEEFDEVTDFVCGVAAVSKNGSPIQIIDTKGVIVATLPDSVITATRFNFYGYSIVENISSTGIVDRKGNVVLQGKLFASIFDNTILYVDPDKEGTLMTADLEGNKLGEYSMYKWSLASMLYSEGKLAVYEHQPNSEEPNEDAPITIIDTKGQKLFDLKKSYAKNCMGAIYFDDLITYRAKDMTYGVANNIGEDVIRPKYQELAYVGDKEFIAKKNNKYGIIDLEDNVIVPFDYDGAIWIKLGEKFLLSKDSNIYIVDTNGKKLNKNGFAIFAYYVGTQVKTGKNIEKLEKNYRQKEDNEIPLQSDYDEILLESDYDEIPIDKAAE